jgi:hypothetical protein
MTRSKLEFATILATMRGQGEDPAKLAQDMSLRKLCYEIEKLEQAAEEAAKVQEAPKEQEPPKKPPRQKHILSWLLDSSSEDES